MGLKIRLIGHRDLTEKTRHGRLHARRHRACRAGSTGAWRDDSGRICI